jgi:hypothetical protein
MGADWLKKQNKMPDPGNLDATHVFLHEIEAANREAVFDAMQGHNWSPNGEARPLIEARGLQHTSMSVGDLLVDQDTWDTYIVDRFGFFEVPVAWAAEEEAENLAEEAADKARRRTEGSS